DCPLRYNGYKDIQVPISAVSTSSHSEQRSQARQSRWYCRNRWESRSVPNFTGKPLQETARGFFMLRDVRWETSDVRPLSDIPIPLLHLTVQLIPIPLRDTGCPMALIINR